jgi:hypothetical protein
MWIEPKTNWTREDVPLPEDFNRIEGNVREIKGEVEDEIKPAIDTLNGIVATKARLTKTAEESITIGANEETTFYLAQLSGVHRHYVISVYSPTHMTAETAGTLSNIVTWYLRRGAGHSNDSIYIKNNSASAATLYFLIAFIE